MLTAGLAIGFIVGLGVGLGIGANNVKRVKELEAELKERVEEAARKVA